MSDAILGIGESKLVDLALKLSEIMEELKFLLVVGI